MSLSNADRKLCSPRREDDQAILTLMHNFDTAVSGEPDTDLDDVHHDWSLIELDRDAWVVKSIQDELIAYAAVLPHQSLGLRIDIYTTPALIESELPHELLDLCLARSNEITGEVGDNGIQHLVGYVVHSNLSFRNLFEQADFTLARYIFEMRKEMPTPPDKSHWPAGIHVRTFKPEQDGFATYELVQEAFDRPGRVRYSFENWKTHMLRPDSFNPDLWTLAFDEGELVGVCLGFNYSQEGWIRQLGVKASAQGRGIGSALLRNAFNTFYSLGKRRVGLTVESDNPDALTFYYRTGMTIKRQYDEYVKVVAPP